MTRGVCALLQVGWVKMRVSAALFVGMAAATRDIVGNAIPGHMKPLGEHKPMLKKIEVLDYVPSTQEFVDVHSKGRGFPFVMRGAAKTMPAWSKWTDAGLLANFKDATLDMVEKAKKETREAGEEEDVPMHDFLRRYNTSDIYAVSAVPPKMKRDVELLDFFDCNYWDDKYRETIMWFSSGGSTSVLHRDSNDNINCLFAGSKRMVFIDFKDQDTLETDDYGWWSIEEEPDSKAYGQFFKHIDVSRMDLEKFPKWRDVDWYEATMEPGDCLYIPVNWYHTVQSFDRNLAANVWWAALRVETSWEAEGLEAKMQCGKRPAGAPKQTLADKVWEAEVEREAERGAGAGGDDGPEGGGSEGDDEEQDERREEGDEGDEGDGGDEVGGEAGGEEGGEEEGEAEGEEGEEGVEGEDGEYDEPPPEGLVDEL
jgi:hypothetical protein